LRKFLNEDPIMGEHVNFFNHHNKRSSGFVVGICEPEPAKSIGYDIEVSIPGKKGAVLKYKSVRRERIMRLRKYLVCDPRWLDYAARTSGFAKSEISLRISRMADEIERMPDTSHLRKVTAYKNTPNQTDFPIVAASWRRPAGS